MMLKDSHTYNLLLGKYSLDQQTLEMKQDLIWRQGVSGDGDR